MFRFSKEIIFIVFILSMNKQPILGVSFEDYCAIDKDNLPCRTKCVPNAEKCDHFNVISANMPSRKTLLNSHNEHRNKVTKTSPIEWYNLERASNMRALSYDVELEFFAICILALCEDFTCGVGNNARTTGDGKDILDYTLRTLGNSSVGFNPLSEPQSQTADDPLEKWFTRDGDWCWHQLVWATASKVGCARAIRKEAGEFKIQTLCVYNQKADGREATFIEGVGASNCPAGLAPNSKFTGLCGNISRFMGMENYSSPYEKENALTPSFVTEKYHIRCSSGNKEVLGRLIAGIYAVVALVFIYL